MLFVPASSERKLAKLAAVGAESVIVDLEDTVTADDKAPARRRAAAAIAVAGDRVAVHVKVNASASGLLADDVRAVVGPGLAGLVVPKVESAAELRELDGLVSAAERSAGVAPGQVAVMAIVETAAGLRAVDEIASSGGRLARLCFGAGDFALDIGIDWPDPLGTPPVVLLAKSQLVLASRAAGLASPHDSVYPRYRDVDGLRSEALEARRLGFAGKHVIHPDQVPVVESVFRPTDAEVARARRLVAALEEAERTGSGAAGVDGELVDRAIALRARRLLADAGAAAGDPDTAR